MTGMSGDDSKIKVMHIIQSPGGVERYIRNFLKYINHEQFHNILICSDNKIYNPRNNRGNSNSHHTPVECK